MSSSERHEYVHPAFRTTLNALCPAPLDPLAGPLTPEQPLNLRLTYEGTILRLAELADTCDFRTVADLPPLEPDEIAVALERFPDAFLDSVADSTSTRTLIIGCLANRQATRQHQSSMVGIVVMLALGDFLRPIIWKHVQAQRESNRREKAIERESARSEERAAVRTGAQS